MGSAAVPGSASSEVWLVAAILLLSTARAEFYHDCHNTRHVYALHRCNYDEDQVGHFAEPSLQALNYDPSIQPMATQIYSSSVRFHRRNFIDTSNNSFSQPVVARMPVRSFATRNVSGTRPRLRTHLARVMAYIYQPPRATNRAGRPHGT